jgi:hypothetical protein
MRYLLQTAVIPVAFTHVAQAGDMLPEVARKEMNSYVGTWEGTLDLDGKSSPARWSVAWSPGKQCIVFHEEYDLDDPPPVLASRKRGQVPIARWPEGCFTLFPYSSH